MSGPGDNRARVEAQLVACQDRLLARIRWMMGEPARRVAESQDFLNEVVARILDQAAALHWRDESHFLALASRIARNLIVDRVRRPRVRAFESFSQSVLGDATAGAPSPSQAALDGEDVEAVLQALERLAPEQQRVIELRHFEELSFREIGTRTGRSEKAAQMLHARALVRLGRSL